MRMSILIAEDEKELRQLLQLNIEKEGYHVLCAKDGREAFDLFTENSVELCIFDIMMPELDGFQLVSRIREKSTVPILMLTARGDELDKVISFRLGADDYLVKPFSMVELMARIAASLRRSREYSTPKVASLLQFGELVLDRNACSVSKAGNAIELNAKEYLLLKFLMENPERVFTKKQLYHAVWQEDYLYDNNTVMVHISRLRNKIEADPGKPVYIITIKGIGYKFCKRGKAIEG